MDAINRDFEDWLKNNKPNPANTSPYRAPPSASNSPRYPRSPGLLNPQDRVRYLQNCSYFKKSGVEKAGFI